MILADRSERPEGQGIPTASGDGRYHFERQVAADRYSAAHLLGVLRDPRGIALLVPLLDDPETQWTVPWALGEIGDKRAIPPLIASLDKDDRKSNFGAGVTVSEAAKAAVAKLQWRRDPAPKTTA